MLMYRVGYCYTEYGVATVIADSKEQAYRVVNTAMDNSGTDNSVVVSFEPNNREFFSQDAERVKY